MHIIYNILNKNKWHISKKTLQQNFHLILLYVCFNNNKHYDLEMPNFPKKKKKKIKPDFFYT